MGLGDLHTAAQALVSHAGFKPNGSFGLDLLRSTMIQSNHGAPISLADVIDAIPPGYVLTPRQLVLKPGELAANRGIIDPD